MEKLFQQKIIFKIISVFCFFNSLLFILIGIHHTVFAFYYLYRSFTTGNWQSPGLYAIEALDAFMVGLLFIIFSYGIYRIFMKSHADDSLFPAWLRISSLSELKTLLWETILLTLAIISITIMMENEKLSWEALISPLITLVLSMAFLLVHRRKQT
ncbi:MAG TPA: YqhA family protein [Puia sp.]|nr:YqhA family protein [Puia sp.]